MVEDPILTANPLSRDAILSFTAEPFPVDAFGGTVYVRPLTGEERDKYEASNLEQRKNGTTRLNLANARARLAQLCLVERDEKGRWRRMFTRNEIDKLGQLPAVELDKVTEAAREASGLDAEAEEALVEDFDEEPPGLRGGSSSSALQATSA
jgi:hypothetical protein